MLLGLAGRSCSGPHSPWWLPRPPRGAWLVLRFVFAAADKYRSLQGVSIPQRWPRAGLASLPPRAGKAEELSLQGLPGRGAGWRLPRGCL